MSRRPLPPDTSPEPLAFEASLVDTGRTFFIVIVDTPAAMAAARTRGRG
jgi:hypothetical protein